MHLWCQLINSAKYIIWDDIDLLHDDISIQMTNLCKRTKYNLTKIPHSDYIVVNKSLISAKNVYIEMSIVSHVH